MTEQVGVEFLFDTKGAQKNTDQLSQSMNKMDAQNKSASKSGMLAMGAAVALGNIMTQGFNKLMGKMGSAIPALGQTLDQAGTVIFNNLFKPLSDILMPLLQKLMNWVRDNRTGFVQLGSVISSAFKLLFSVVSTVFGIIKRIAEKFFSAVTGGAKASFKGVADFFNMLLLKISFIIQFVLMLVEPVIDMIADLFIWLGKNVIGPFFSGFIDGMMEMFGPIDSLTDAFGEVWEALKTIGSWFSGEGSIIADFFKFIGKISGAVLVAPLRMAKEAVILLFNAFAMLVKGIDYLIKNAKNIGPGILNGLSAAGAAIRDFFGSVVEWAVKKFNSIIDWFKNLPDMISRSVGEGMDAAGKYIEAKMKSLKRFFGFGGNEAAVQATGAAVGNSSSDNRQQNATYNINVNGAQDTAATGKALLNQAQGRQSIQNQEAARGGR